MKRTCTTAILLAITLLVGCAGPGSRTAPAPTLAPASTLAPAPASVCHQAGTLATDAVFFADTGEDHAIRVYLPPCYEEQAGAAFPVLYWTTGYGQDLFDSADRLIGQGLVRPFIIVMLYISPLKGYGADKQINSYVVTYIDSHYRTRAEPSQRSITGISHGAAIAVRSAFRPPHQFGRVALLSGGIADGEQEKFTAWIKDMQPGQEPAVLIDVGDLDGIRELAQHLMNLLDGLGYPYTFTHGTGNHEEKYWAAHLEEYLKWLEAEK
jgi:enterochelin esterase-like enzyme